jgi:PTH1 family peptidyl-tRNA hydrolase
MAARHEIGTENLDKIIVGLGNPGQQYNRNRHNAGFMVVEAIAREAAGKWSNSLFSRICRIEIGKLQVLLAEPLTYMNHSGTAVHELLLALELNPDDLLIVLDDLNLPLGRIRIRERGSAGGHHGLESIVAALGTEEILRLRLGIGEERMPRDKTDFVLSDFPAERQAELEEMIINAGNAVKSILNDGVSKSMAMFNA